MLPVPQQDGEGEGRLRLDWKGGWQEGGDSGAAIIPGRVGKSLLIQAIRYSDAELEMPPKKRLTAEQVADFEKWIAMGAPDPRRVPRYDGGSATQSRGRPPVLGLSAGDQTG